ncbi:PDR/VanB family oxidoreductase [Novosphingobium colocasiae]
MWSAAMGRLFPYWSPGAHLDLALPEGLGRQYSLCGGSADGMTLRFAVLREPAGRGGSRFLHEAVAVGDTLEVAALRNNFPLVEADRYLLVAGGIGITPLLAMARQLESQGRDWTLLYGGRNRASMAFLEPLAEFGDRVIVRPADECGLLDIAGFLGADAPGKVAYCCGPEPLIAAVEAHCADWPEEALQLERFHPRMQAAPPAAAGSFLVELRQSGITIEVPADRTIADVAEDAGVYIPRSCNEGTCGTCITKVIEGLPDHRDSFLRPKQRAENKRIMPCCSRSLSARLVLDV